MKHLLSIIYVFEQRKFILYPRLMNMLLTFLGTIIAPYLFWVSTVPKRIITLLLSCSLKVMIVSFLKIIHGQLCNICVPVSVQSFNSTYLLRTQVCLDENFNCDKDNTMTVNLFQHFVKSLNTNSIS